MIFKTFLEKSYGPGDIPKYFYLATKLDKAFDGLMKKKFIGILGVSSTKNIAGIASPNSNVTIEMNAKKVLASNKLSRVMYDNPEYIVQDNFDALKRLAPLADETDTNTEILQFFMNSWAIYDNKTLHLKVAFKLCGLNRDFNEMIKSSFTNIKNLHDLAKKTKASVDKFLNKLMTDNKLKRFIAIEKVLNYKIDTYVYYFKACIEEIMINYDEEEEWRTKDKIFIIPNKSTLYLRKCQQISGVKIEKQIDKLKTLYKVKRGDNFYFDQYEEI